MAGLAMEFDGERAVRAAMDAGATFCDVRMERTEGLTIEMRDRTVSRAVHGRREGVAVRVLAGGAWGFLSTNVALDEGEAVEIALANARIVPGGDTAIADAEPETSDVELPVKVAPRDVPIDEKVSFLADLADHILGVMHIGSVDITYDDGTRDVRVLNSEGSDVRSRVTRTMAQANIAARDGSNMVGYRFRVGGTRGFEVLDDAVLAAGEVYALRAAALLTAQHPPSGAFTMVTDPELTGVFIHEAIGHAVESDLVATGGSILEGRLGERIGTEEVNVFDDPTIPGAFGSFPFDDEGMPARRKELIVGGVLRDLITGRETARRLGLGANGGTRAMDYGSRPIVRMSNTLMGGGDMTLEELLDGVRTGILARGTRGGTVDTEKGTFQFSASEAQLIERGELTRPLRDVSFAGDVLGTLRLVEGMTREVEMGQPGFCGKGAGPQIVPVGDGGPYVRFSRMVIGGR